MSTDDNSPDALTRHVIARAARGAGTRPQLQLAAVNGHSHRGHITPVVVPLGRPYVDVDLAAIERSAQRRAARAAERAELDAALAADAHEHISTRGTLHHLPPATRTFVRWYLAFVGTCFAAVVAVAWYAWAGKP